MNKDITTTSGSELLFTGEAWFDPIEANLRGRVRGFIETMLEEELSAALGRGRYQRGEGKGHRHGKRERQLLGSFGPVTVSVPRARLAEADGTTQEWRSAALPRYARMTRQAEALIASTYLAGTNTRRVKRALGALFKGAVGKDVVSRTWRRVKADWDAWNRRSLADEDIVRLILDGTVVRVRLDRQATSISLLVVLGIRSDGQKVLLSVRNMGGESEAAWRGVLDDLLARGLRTPQFLIIDGAAGLERALAALWPAVPTQRCTVHKHRNLLAHAPEKLHDEITADYTDMIYADERPRDREAAPCFPAQVAAEVPRRRRQLGGSRRPAVHLHPAALEPVEVGAHDQRDRAAARRVQAPHQDANRAALGRDRGDAVLGLACFRTDHHAQGRWMAEPRREAD